MSSPDVYQAGTLASYPKTLSASADVVAYLGKPLVDSCHTPTAFGTLSEAEAGCGLVVARDGMDVSIADDEPQAIFVANGRNPIFVRTQFEDIDVSGEITHRTMLSLRVITESDDPKVLCHTSVITREHFLDGIEEVAVGGLPDPKEPYNPATLFPGEEGNTFYIIPFALSTARQPPYPEMTVVLAPLLVHEVCSLHAHVPISRCDGHTVSLTNSIAAANFADRLYRGC